MKANKNSDRLGKEPITRLLLRLSIPAMIGMAIQALYNVVDSIYIGHLSKEALSAISLVFPIQIILIAISVGTGIGTSSYISRLLGKDEDDKAQNVANHVFVIVIFYSILVGLFGYLYSDKLLHFFTDVPELISLGTRYIRIILIGSVALFFPIITNNIIRGQGNTLIPTIGLAIGAITNIILDPFLIFGIWIFPKLGIEGAAVATIFARFLSGIFLSFFLFKERLNIKINIKKMKFNPKIIYKIYQVGFPAMLMQILGSIRVTGVNKIVASYNVLAIAVVGIFFKLQSFILMPIFGLNHGYIPIIGYNYGRDNKTRIKKTIQCGMFIAFGITFFGFLLFTIFPKQLILLFNDNPELVKIGTNALRKIGPSYLFIGLAIVASSTFQAFGNGFPSLIVSFLRQIIILLPSMYILGKVFGLSATWISFPLSEFISTVVIFLWLYLFLKKKKILNPPSEKV